MTTLAYEVPERAGAGLAAPEAADVRLAVHDASRVEWTLSLPLPEKGDRKYAVEVTFDIPANAFVAHEPWDQLQSVTRLDGASEAFASVDASIDALRRRAVGVAQKLARAHEGFARHARLAGALSSPTSMGNLEGLLSIWLDASAKVAHDARSTLVRPQTEDNDAIARERHLVDEYVSTRFIEMLAGAARSLATLSGSRSPHVPSYLPTIAIIEDRVAAALEQELVHRKERGYVLAEADSNASLETYVNRASQLKKHFHEVLFLDKETFEVAKRIHHWVAAFVAVIASTWAFAWQIALASRAADGSSVGPRLLTLAALAGVVYATKDRIKEVGRTWISGHVHRLYAQRVVRFRAPARRLAGRDVVATAREAFDQIFHDRPDPLHPDSGAVMRTVSLHFRHAGAVHACNALSGGNARHVKYVFRYDFSPLFARLGDAVRKVAVLDPKTHRLAFREAPRCYRVPLRVAVTCEGRTMAEAGTLILSKRGLERLECGGEETDVVAAEWLY